jgi:hypothetical protein
MLSLPDPGMPRRGGRRCREVKQAPCRATITPRRLTEAVVAGHGRQGIAVGDGLAEAGEIRPHAQRLPAAAGMQAEAGAHVVDHQRRIGLVAQLAHGAGEFGRRQRLVHAVVVAEGRDQDARQVAPRLLGGLGHAVDVVVVVIQDMRPVFRGDAGQGGRAPWHRAVIGAARHQQLAPAGAGPRQGDGEGGGVAAILLELHPVGMGDARHQRFRQLHHYRRGAVHAVALLHLAAGGFLHLRVAVAQDDRAPAAHEVHVMAAVGIGQAAALPAGEILRIALR